MIKTLIVCLILPLFQAYHAKLNYQRPSIVRFKANSIVNNSTYNEPPPHDQIAKMARYIVHSCDWTALATVSGRDPIVGYPFANIFSVSDGPVSKSTGIPYMYLTDMEISMQDLKADPRTSITMSLAQTNFCKKQKYDPESPLCAHIILTGRLVKVIDPKEITFARKALFTRHPEMKDWPKSHEWWFGKLDITHICLLDYFGGVQHVDVDEYYWIDYKKIKTLHENIFI